jgi:hypothetical protein
MAKKYTLQLTTDERSELEQLLKKGKAAGWKLQRAQALLPCDQRPHGPGWTDELVAAAYGCTTRSLESWRKQAVEAGPLSLLQRKPRLTPPVPPQLDGEQQARLTAPACSQPPAGTPAGPSACWPSGWSNWRSSIPSRTRPRAAR